MKAHDFINSSIGAKVKVLNNYDFFMSGEYKKLRNYKGDLFLEGLTKGGMAKIRDEAGNLYCIPPRNIREVDK